MFNHKRFMQYQFEKLIVGLVIVILLAVVCLFTSCHSNESKEQPESSEAKVKREADSIAAPLIANEIGDLNLTIESAKNRTLPDNQREYYLDLLRKNFVEYMGAAVSPETYTGKPANTYFTSDAGLTAGKKIVLDSIYSKKFDEYANMQQQYIKAKWEHYAAGIVYKEALLKQQQAQDAVDELNDSKK